MSRASEAREAIRASALKRAADIAASRGPREVVPAVPCPIIAKTVEIGAMKLPEGLALLRLNALLTEGETEQKAAISALTSAMADERGEVDDEGLGRKMLDDVIAALDFDEVRIMALARQTLQLVAFDKALKLRDGGR